MRHAIALAATLSTALAGASLAVEVPFSAKQTIQNGLGQASVAVAADFDRDGDLDVLGCTEGFATGVFWWENTAGDASAWTQEALSAAFDCRQVVAADLDRDGDLDALGIAWEVGQGGVRWWENDLAGASAWLEHMIDADAAEGFAVAAGDLDRDGDLDVIAGGPGLQWWESDGTPADGGWTARAVPGAGNVAGIAPADLDGDGDLDLATAGGAGGNAAVFWESDGASPPVFARHEATVTFGTSHQIAAGDVNDDGRLDLVVTSASDGEISWFDRTGPGLDDWTEHLITATVPSSEWTRVADLDGDGDLDVLGTARSGGKVAWFENADGTGTAWTERVLLIGWNNARAIEPADLDGDGDLDVLAASLSAGEVAWWENLTLHRSALFPERHTVGAVARAGESPLGTSTRPVLAIDFDRDGDSDLVGTESGGGDLLWWENDGTPCTPACTWPEHLIDGSVDNVWAIDAADLDGDGDLDLLGGAALPGAAIVWWEDDGSWTRHLVASSFEALSVHAADLDGDGDLDVLGSSFADGEVHWWENDGTACSPACAWPEHAVDDDFFGARSVRAVDLDGDGDLDVLAAGATADAVAWWENDGTPCSPSCSWPEHTIATGFDEAWFAAAADLDGDGDLDVLATATGDDRILWWENDGTACSPACSWPERTLDPAFDTGPGGVAGDRPVRAVDLDGDGDLDVIGASRTANLVAWWENDGTPCASACSWPEHVVDGAFAGALSVDVADFDRDGALDVAAVGTGGVAWWNDRGGQLALPTADAVLAPVVLEGSENVSLLRIDGVHRGRTGDGDAELATLALRFEEAPGDPLTGGELGALVQFVRLFVDDGDGVFEPFAGDAPFHSVSAPFALAGGVLTLPLADADPDVQLAVGGTTTWWLSADLQIDAGGAVPDGFAVVHQTASSNGVVSTGEMSATDLPLALDHQADVASSTLTVLATEIFADGFESGDTSAWSSTVGN